MAKIAKDQFANLAHIRVTESAANTLTFQELTTGIATFEKIAFVLHRIEYSPYPATIALVLGTGDVLDMALVTSNQITDLLKDKPQVIDKKRLSCVLHGTPANLNVHQLPYVQDFTSLPGGGLIIPSSHIYGAVMGTSLGSAATVDISMYFTFRELEPAEYWELVEATRALT